jgi:hypothetical protein
MATPSATTAAPEISAGISLDLGAGSAGPGTFGGSTAGGAATATCGTTAGAGVAACGTATGAEVGGCGAAETGGATAGSGALVEISGTSIGWVFSISSGSSATEGAGGGSGAATGRCETDFANSRIGMARVCSTSGGISGSAASAAGVGAGAAGGGVGCDAADFIRS